MATINRISCKANAAAGQPFAPAEKGRNEPGARAAWAAGEKNSGRGASHGGGQWRGWRCSVEMETTSRVPCGSTSVVIEQHKDDAQGAVPRSRRCGPQLISKEEARRRDDGGDACVRRDGGVCQRMVVNYIVRKREGELGYMAIGRPKEV